MAEPEDDLDILAGEWVLGTLNGPERAALAERLADDPDMAARVAYWEERLAPLLAGIEPVAPPATLWPAIERAIGTPARPSGLWNLLGFWRGLGLAATAAAAVMAGLLLTRPVPVPPAPAPLAVLADETRQATWLARVEPEGVLSVSPLRRVDLPADRAFELWLITGAQAAPQSLGLVPVAGRSIRMPVDRLAPGMTLAVSLEPQQGSPSGLPTGPVLHVGTIVSAALR